MADTALARRLKRLTASFKRHGFAHVVEVFRQERIRRNYARSPSPLPSEAELLRQFDIPKSGVDRLVDDLLQRSAQLLPLHGSDEQSRTAFITALTRNSSDEQILSDAEFIATGRFPALGLCICEPSGTFAWHRDYGSGKEWPLEEFHRIRYLDGDGADVKYVWELSRMYWIGWLGKAFLLTGDERWAEEFKRLIDSWRTENPVNMGVNWTVAMEVGIRGFWLVAGSAFFRDSRTLTNSWWAEYFSLIWGHGTWIKNNLEYFSNLTNHYIANCFGLVAIGALFSNSSTGTQWFNDGKRRLEKELDRQITSDGVHYERSIGYHGLVLEMYLIALRLSSQAGEPFSANAAARIEFMADFTLHYTPPNEATIPQLGDSDNGTIVRLRSNQELYDHRGLLAIAGTLFDRQDMVAAGAQKTEQALVLLGHTFHERRESEKRHLYHTTSKIYQDGGFAILRNEQFFVFSDIGPIGLHGNNDTLAFTLHTIDGTSWFVDPGTGCYTRDEQLRNTLRSTAAHNTPCIDGIEIAEFTGLWRVREDRTNTTVVESMLAHRTDNSHTVQRLVAEHYAYDRTNITVRREWQLEPELLSIRDIISGTGKHDISVGFTVPNDIRVRQVDSNTVELRPTEQTNASCKLLFSSSMPLRVNNGFYSPEYGIILPATRIEIVTHASFPLEIAYLCRFVAI